MLFFMRIFCFLFLLTYSILASGDERYFTKEDLEFAKTFGSSGKSHAMESIRKKYQELKSLTRSRMIHSRMSHSRMEHSRMHHSRVSDSDEINKIVLKVFVSTSMNKSLLKTYVKAAKKYNASLVFRGLPSGSWHELHNLVSDITENKEEAFSMQIDDTAFEEYQVTKVPTFVLVKEKSIFDSNLDQNFTQNQRNDSDQAIFEENRTYAVFDKVSGNIGIKRALDIFSQEGDLATFATNILEIGQEEDVQPSDKRGVTK